MKSIVAWCPAAVIVLTKWPYSWSDQIDGRVGSKVGATVKRGGSCHVFRRSGAEIDVERRTMGDQQRRVVRRRTGEGQMRGD